MAYKPNYATGDLIDVTIWQELVNRAIYIFANPSARDNASTGITSPTEGQFCYLLDTTGSGGGSGLQYYNGSAWANTSLTADITGVVAGDGLSGGGTTGDVTVALDLNELTGATVDVANDSVPIVDATDNSSKKETVADLVSGIASTNKGLTASSGTLAVDPSNLADGSGITVDTANDLLMLEDAIDGTVYKVKPNQIVDTTSFADIGLVIALG